MATGAGDDEKKPIDIEQDVQSAGLPAAGELEGSAYNPLGNPGMHHWQQSFITEPGLDDRGNVFFAAIQMTRMPMVVTDPNQPDNPIVFVNRAFLDLTEYREEDILGRNCRFLQGAGTDPATVAEVREALKEHRAVAVDILNYKADGKPFWNALFIGPVFDREGKLLYYFASQLDITRRQVSEQAYFQSQKMEAIGQLTAGLAHDFNNLLQVVSGNHELAMLLLRDNDDARRIIERAQQGIQKASKLTQQLLTFARKQRLEPRRVSLNSLVVEFSEMLVRTLGDKVNLHLDLRPDIPLCTLDPVHMEMALLNVLINARDAMPSGGKVTVGTSVLNDRERVEAHELAPGTYVMICIIDEGEGMPPEVARRATEPFFTTKRTGGTGLGLAMVHGFVRQSHGHLEIDSQPGRGTTIRMIFPIADRSPQEISAARLDEQRALNAPGWSETSIREQRTILVVDDNEDIRDMAQGFLHAEGYRVLAAQSGEEALALLERYGTIDLLFSDVIMPGGMNGLQLVERVRILQPDVPVLLATGYMEQLPHEGVLPGSFQVLAKPFRLADLSEVVRGALRKQPAERKSVAEFRHEG